MWRQTFHLSVILAMLISRCYADESPTAGAAARERIGNCRLAISHAMMTPYVERSPCSTPAGPNTTCDVACTAAPGGWIVAVSAGSAWRCRLYVTFEAFTEAQLPCGLQTPAH